METGDGLSFKGWRDKMFFWAITTAIAGSIGWASWLTVSMQSRPTESEVERMVSREQRLIEAQVQQLDILAKRSTLVIDKNTDAINALRIELARLAERLKED